MCEHLDKAKGALSAAADRPAGLERERLLSIAEVQAQVSQAESLAQIVQLLGPQFVMNPVQIPPTPPAGGGWRYKPPYEGLNNAS